MNANSVHPMEDKQTATREVNPARALISAERSGRFIALMAALFCVMIVAVLWHTYRESTSLLQSTTLNNAQIYSDAIASFRTVYTREVVPRAKASGIKVTHDYHDHAGAIPLPATLSMKLGETMGLKHNGATIRLYSDKPFPWRSDGGPKDDFEQAALAHLRENPGKPYFEFDESEGHQMLRYATADLMRESCIKCHNTHPESPKQDWKVGDVRGVLSLSMPMHVAAAQSQNSLVKTFVMLLSLSAFGLIGIAFATRSHRRGVHSLQSSNEALERVNRELDHQQTLLQASLQQQEDINDELLQAKRQADERAIELDRSRKAAINMMCDANTAKQHAEEAQERLRVQAAQLEQSNLALTESRQQLSDSVRKAAMAELAAGVLHNVGNVLNSINVSAGMIGEILSNSRVGTLVKTSQLMKEHEHDLVEFIGSDPKGQKLPLFINQLTDVLVDEQKSLQDELSSMNVKVKHVKDIVKQQMSLARVSTVVEKFDVTEAIGDALLVFGASMANNGIEIERDSQNLGTLKSDRNKVIEILVNYIGNARQAMEDVASPRVLRIAATQTDQAVHFEVTDSGSGIDQDAIGNIFQHGYTTKKDGHGFGLHYCQMIAAELGGKVSVSSPGKGKGATFTLSLPLVPPHRPTDEEAEPAPESQVPASV